MKFFVTISVFVTVLTYSVLASVNNENRLSGRAIGKIDISNQIDEKLALVKQLLLEKGFDPLTLPDVTKPITIRPILIKHHGTLTLKQGWLQGLRSIVREGPAYLAIGVGSTQRILLNLTIVNIEFGYDYRAKFAILRRSGQVLGYANELQLSLELKYNIFKKMFQVQKAEFYSVGDMDVRLSGNVVGDIIGNFFVESAVQEIRESILDALNDALNRAIDDINEVLKPKLSTSTEFMELTTMATNSISINSNNESDVTDYDNSLIY